MWGRETTKVSTLHHWQQWNQRQKQLVSSAEDGFILDDYEFVIDADVVCNMFCNLFKMFLCLTDDSYAC